MASSSAIGQEVKSYVSKGELITDHMANSIVLSYAQNYSHQSFILDGYPRTVSQAAFLKAHYKQPVVAVNIVLDRHITIEKLLGRRICSTCRGDFNTAHAVHGEYDMPAILPSPDTCKLTPPSSCKPCLEKRGDDTEEVIRKRLAGYDLGSSSLLKFYEEANLLIEFQVKKGVKDTPLLLEKMNSF